MNMSHRCSARGARGALPTPRHAPHALGAALLVVAMGLASCRDDGKTAASPDSAGAGDVGDASHAETSSLDAPRGAETDVGSPPTDAPIVVPDGVADATPDAPRVPDTAAPPDVPGPPDTVVPPDVPGPSDAVMPPDVPGPPDTVVPPDVPGVPDVWPDVGPDLGPDTVPDIGPPCVPSGCGWEGDGCVGPTALLRVVPLDIWTQPLLAPSVTLAATAGPDLPLTSGGTWEAPLCGSGEWQLDVSASAHHGFAATVAYDGLATADSLAVGVGWDPLAGALTGGTAEVAGATVPSYTLWVGLPHRWFAATGRPARHGNDVTLMRDGEEAWASVLNEVELAADQVVASSWWWESDFELYRDPWTHPYLSEDDRWPNTSMGALEERTWYGAQVKVLVAQFFSQDGMLDWVNVDDLLTDHAGSPGDGFEFMGHANEASGTFEVDPGGVDFTARLMAAGLVGWGTDWLGAIALEPPVPAIDVDMTELPLGLSVFDIPLASWHQKFLAVDDEAAFVGGMNVKGADWDTHAHAVFEPRRMTFDASMDDRLDVADKLAEPDYGPRKDYMVRLYGPLVADVLDVFRLRWDHQLAEDVYYADLSTPCLPPSPPAAPIPGGVQAQVVATMPAPFDENAILETLLRAISQATEYIYIEDQYFRAPLLAEALVDRLYAVPSLRVIVVTKAINEWVDPGCWQTYLQAELLGALFPSRFRLYQVMSFDWVDTDCTFCFDEVEATFAAIDTHSKLFLVDDVYLEVGSCNHNNRGLLYEGELAVAVFDPSWVRAARDEIFGNILGGPWWDGATPDDFLWLFDMVAEDNQSVWEAWDDEGFDLDLDGDPVPSWMLPDGLLYPLEMDDPDECLFEDVGEDMM